MFCTAVLVFFCASAANAQIQTGSPETGIAVKEIGYPDKKSGDKAYSDGEFKLAAEFYQAYRANAQKANDRASMQDAFEREIDAWLRGIFADQAETALDSYVDIFKEKEDELSVSLWRIHILLLRKKTDLAKEALEKLNGKWENLPKDHPLRLQVISYFAFAAALNGNYAEAARLYGELSAGLDRNSLFGRQSTERCILMLIAAGKTDAALEELQKCPLANRDGRSLRSFQLLRFYLSLKKEKENHTNPDDDWSAICLEEHEKDIFFQMSFLLIAEEFKERKLPEKSFQAYQKALETAPSMEEARDTVFYAVDAMESFGKAKNAADLAWNLFCHFHGGIYPAEVRLKIGGLLCAVHRTEAFEVYKSILTDEKISSAEKKSAFYSANLALQNQKMYEESFRLIDCFFEKSPRSAEHLLQLADINLLEGKKKEAADLYKEAGGKSKPVQKESYGRAIRLYLELKQYDDVIALCSILLQNDPLDPVVYYRAAAFDEKKEIEKALADYQTCEKISSDCDFPDEVTARVYYRIGSLLMDTGKVSEAVESLKKAFAKKYQDYDSSPAAGCQLVFALFRNKSYVDAARVSRELSQRYPESESAAYASFWLASQYRNQASNYAADEIRKAAEQTRFSGIQAQALYEKALLAFRGKDYAEAVRNIDDLESKFPKNENLAAAYYLRGDIRMEQGQFADAVKEYAKAAGEHPDSVLEQAAWGKAGDCYFAMNEYDEAIRFYRKIPENASRVYRIMAICKTGRCLSRQGKQQQALEKYEKLLYMLYPEDAFLHPSETFWVVKGLEDLIIIMLEQAKEIGGSKHIDKAFEAVDWLEKAGVMDRKSANERRNQLRQNNKKDLIIWKIHKDGKNN